MSHTYRYSIIIQLTWPCDGIVLISEVFKVIVLRSLSTRCDKSDVNSLQLCSILWWVQAEMLLWEISEWWHVKSRAVGSL